MKWKSAMFTDLSGSLGGMVASRNKGGNYLRSRVTPTNPQTCRQSAARSMFAELAQEFSELDPELKALWNEAAEFANTDAFGEPNGGTLTGQNLFIRAKRTEKEIATATGEDYDPVTPPPMPLLETPAPTSVGPISYDPDTGLGSIPVNFTTPPSEEEPTDVVVYTGPNKNPCTSSSKGPRQLSSIGTVPPGESGTSIPIDMSETDPSQPGFWFAETPPVDGAKRAVDVVAQAPDKLPSMRFVCLQTTNGGEPS